MKNVLQALGDRRVRVALMTSIGVSVRGNTHDRKRRSERVVRASGNAYTIVRPGWFDYNDDDQLAIRLLQGDTRHAGHRNHLSPLGCRVRDAYDLSYPDAASHGRSLGRLLTRKWSSGAVQMSTEKLGSAERTDDGGST
jgi:hypothetical protein